MLRDTQHLGPACQNVLQLSRSRRAWTATARTAPSIGIGRCGDQEETRYHQQGNHIDGKVTKHTQLGDERRGD